MPYADPFDATTPTDANPVGQGDDRIRELKRAINQRMADLANGWPDGPLSLKIPNLYIVAAMIANKTITAAQIADATITALQLADGAVGTAELANGAVTDDKLAALAVATANVQLEAITDALIASVGGGKIVDDTITTAKYKDASVTKAKLANLSVDTGQLIDLAVTAAKMADSTITMAKLSAALMGKLGVPKYVDLAIAADIAIASRATSTLADIAFPGAVAGDGVIVGLPASYAAATDGSQDKLVMMAAVAKADAITPVLRNNNDGANTWHAGTVRFWITKSASAWGANL